MEFSRQEYWSGLPFPSPGDLPDPGIETASLVSPALAGRFFTTRATWEVQYFLILGSLSLVAQMVKRLPAMWETRVRSLGQEDPLGNGNPLQYSCLENSMDGEAWWATVHGVAKSRTRLSDFTFFHFLYSKTQAYYQ